MDCGGGDYVNDLLQDYNMRKKQDDVYISEEEQI